MFIVIAGSKAMRHKKRAPKVEKKLKKKIPTVFFKSRTDFLQREKLTTFEIIIIRN